MSDRLALLKEFITAHVATMKTAKIPDRDMDTPEDEPTKLELLPADLSPTHDYNGRTVRKRSAPVSGGPKQNGWRA